MAEETKNTIALLNGLARRTYYKEDEITDEFLKSQIYPEMSDEDFNRLVSRFSGLMKNMVSADMDFNQLEAFVVSQTKRREGALTEDQANALRRFWRSHKNKIHDSLVVNTNWNNSLKQVSWRIDVKSQSKNVDQINEPTAIMELQLQGGGNTKNTEVVQFEMDENKLMTVLQSMKDIESEIGKYSQQ
ncbi:COMM domain-containing protein 1-like [Pecten maximus]|uniref:COMM domain-containing protein 1-like n=1 Tax=Pecten maximus TaxID=6579 RepID=UPI00145867AE|nr:COMM domain-containing protein 1-like [Pecten maximus]